MDQTPPAGARVAVAMSGGVDSSVAACLLQEAGCDVTGVTLKVFCYGHGSATERACCSYDAIEYARGVAAGRGFPHYVFDVAGLFEREVIERFTAEYLRGRTPNPCILCNQQVKFGPLFERAAALGCEWVATGHYARAGRSGSDRALRIARGADRAKDQSYVLWGLDPAVMRRLTLPLGRLAKSDVREAARRFGLSVAERPESQDICFVGTRTYAEYIAARAPADAPQLQEGPILDPAGREIGRHRGAARYTVGQRHGLGLADGGPFYVVAVDAQRNAVHVGPAEALAAAGLRAGETRFFGAAPAAGDVVAVQIRSRHSAAPARVVRVEDDAFDVAFDTPQVAVAPGQSAVLYAGDEVVGGGVIESAERVTG
jgi:tRNA-specific 2-thiouridylase